MKYCLNNRISVEYLRQADEIMVAYRDRKAIMDIAEKYPEARIIVDTPPYALVDEIEWGLFVMFEKAFKSRNKHLTICVSDLRMIDLCRVNGLSHYFYKYPAENFYDAHNLKALGVCELRISAELSHMLSAARSLELPLRLAPNITNYSAIPDTLGIAGQWVRPEDVKEYEEYIDVFEFMECEKSQEEALFRLYSINHNWPGKIADIITFFNNPAVNRLIAPLGNYRVNCGSKCIKGGACHICHRILHVANEELIRSIKE